MTKMGSRDPAISLGGGFSDALDTETALRLAQLVIARSKSGIFWIDRRGRILYVNETGCRQLGYTAGELSAMSIYDIDPEVTVENWPRAWERIKERRSYSFEAAHRAKSGHLVPLQVSNYYLEHNGQEVFCSVCRDITERRRIEESLRSAKEEAERANTAKSRFLAAASHDLRQPLHAMELLASVLSGKALDVESQAIVFDMQESLALMGRLLNALLDISELEAGMVVPKVQAVEVNLLLRRIKQQYDVIARQKGVELRVRESDAVVRSDPGLLERILANLVANAVNYTDSGRVLLGCRRRGGARQVIEIWDTGPGIPTDRLSAVFEDFCQLDHTARDRGAGLGLGLGIVRRLGSLLDHGVEVRSQPGRGSVFRVDIEAAPVRAHRAADHHPHEPPGMGVGVGTLVVIDDDNLVLSAMQQALESWGYDVVAAGSTAEAVAALSKDDVVPDLIIADYRLSGEETGVWAVETLREKLGQGLPAVIVTGDIAPETLRHLADSGLRVLQKPVRPAKLRALVRHMTEGQAQSP
jgi:PAS domain S-box-containing protein